MIEQFVGEGYKRDVAIQQIQEVDQLDQKRLLHHQKYRNKQCMLLSVTYSRALPNLKDILTKHGHILQANQSCRRAFSTLPIIVSRSCTSLKQIIGKKYHPESKTYKN